MRVCVHPQAGGRRPGTYVAVRCFAISPSWPVAATRPSRSCGGERVRGQGVECHRLDYRLEIRIRHRQLLKQCPPCVVRPVEQDIVTELREVEREEPDRDVPAAPRSRAARRRCRPRSPFEHHRLAIERGPRTPVSERNSSVKLMPLQLVSTVVPSGAIRIAVRCQLSSLTS